jgi:hypothetical protein
LSSSFYHKQSLAEYRTWQASQLIGLSLCLMAIIKAALLHSKIKKDYKMICGIFLPQGNISAI